MAPAHGRTRAARAADALIRALDTVGAATLVLAPVVALVAALSPLTPSTAQAQSGRFDLTLTGGPLMFASPTAADFVAGFAVHPAGLSFQVDIANNAHPNTVFQTTVTVRATSPTLGTNGKPIGDLQWSLGGTTGPWTALSLADVAVETRAVRRNRLNDPWLNVLHFRMLLDWATDGPGTYGTNIVVTLTVTGP